MEQHTLRQQQERRIQDTLQQECEPDINRWRTDPDVIEILATGTGEVWLDRLSVGKERTGVMLSEVQRLMIIGTVAAWHGLVVNRDHPLLKAELPPDGARFQGMIRPVSAPAFVIRRPFTQILPLEQYVKDGSMTPWQVEVLRDAIAQHAKILVGGATLSGKTVLANSLIGEMLAYHGHHLRVVLIEDTYELTMPPGAVNVEHLHTTETTDLRTLIQTAMRLSPECLVVGEVRGPEAWDLLNAWSTGHGGSVSTIHAEHAQGALRRFAMLMRQGGVEPDHELIGSTVNLVIIMERRGARQWHVRELVRCEGWDGQRYVVTTPTPTGTSGTPRLRVVPGNE